MKWKKYMAFLLAVSCVMLTGCRESEIIQNVILTQDASEVDDTEVLDPKQQEQIDEIAQFVSEKQKEEAKNNPDNVENSAGNGEEASENTSGANTGNTTGESGENHTTTDGEDNDRGENTSGDNPSDNPGGSSGIDQENPGGRLEDDPNARQIYDESGNIVNLPEFVSSVAAPSDAGLIVQMLGGSGMLTASSGDLLSSSLAQAVFADEGISEVTQLWEEDGSSGMTDGNFQKLLQMHPDCVIVFNRGNNLSDAQLIKLKEADIPVVHIPKLSTAKNIESAVRIVGETLGDNSSEGGLNSQQLAMDYVSYAQDLVMQVSKKNGICSYLGYDFYDVDGTGNSSLINTKGTYSPTADSRVTLYIDGWDDDAYLHGRSPFDQAVYQTGLAYIDKDYEYHAMTWYLSNAGVVDAVSQISSMGKLYLDPTHVRKEITGNTEGFAVYDWNYTNLVKHLVAGNADMTITFFSLPYSDSSDSSKDSDFLGFLGDDSYPAVLVSSQEIADKMNASKSSNTGLYRKGDFDVINGIQGHFLKYDGISDDLGGNDMVSGGLTTDIYGDYDIYVNPCGVGSWTDGSVEGFLESVWASSKFYGSYSDGQVKEKIKEFYRNFYRHELTDEQLNDILDGK